MRCDACEYGYNADLNGIDDGNARKCRKGFDSMN